MGVHCESSIHDLGPASRDCMPIPPSTERLDTRLDWCFPGDAAEVRQPGLRFSLPGKTVAGLLLAAVAALSVLGCEAAAVSEEQPARTPANPPAEREQKVAEPAQPAEAEPRGPQQGPADPGSPFPRRFEIDDFPRGLTWLNVAAPLRLKQDLKGKFVLLDFWTYCCINCMHVLPELRKLERAYPNQLVVIGVHSAKFETEKETDSIREAILRYDIEHPVINDADHKIWDSYGIQSWPTLLLIDPEGYVVWGNQGETKFEELDPVLKAGVTYYRRKKTLDERPFHFQLARAETPETPLRFPGKVLADEASGRLFIADSTNNRIVIATLDGQLVDVVGTGNPGTTNGEYAKAEFNKPQGMVLHGSRLLVADTENHMIRAIDLNKKLVSLVAGTGKQGRGWPGIEDLGPFDMLPERWVGPPRKTNLASPWALWIHGNALYIAMAGPHQIWKMSLSGAEIGPFAGNGREDIVDGPLLPKRPYQLGYSSFAQPSGLASDGKWLYVADSEGSSIRAVPFEADKEVKTVVGSAHLPFARLFEFGDVDGQGEAVRLQHALGVVHHAGKLYIADTYNHKIKAIDPETRTCTTLAGNGKPGRDDALGTFFEPAGISYAAGKLYVADTNNHLIRTVELMTPVKVSTLTIAGLAPPAKPAPKAPTFDDALQIAAGEIVAAPQNGSVAVQVELKLPSGWKVNPLAPMSWYLAVDQAAGPIDRAAVGVRNKVAPPGAAFEIVLPVKAATGEDPLRIGLVYYVCQEGGEGICRVGSVQWKGKLKLDANATATPPKLVADIDPTGNVKKPIGAR